MPRLRHAVGEEQPIEIQVLNTWFMATKEFPNGTTADDHAGRGHNIEACDSLFPGLRAAPPQDRRGSRGRRPLTAEATAFQDSPPSASPPASSESLIRWFDEVDGPRSLRACAQFTASERGTKTPEGHCDTGEPSRLHGSALALVRLIFETFIRGAWLHQCAFDEDWGDSRRTASASRSAIIKDFERGIRLWSVSKQSMPHGLDRQATRTRVTIGQFGATRRRRSRPIASEAEIVEAISFADAIATMSAIEIAHIAGNDMPGKRSTKKVKDTFLRDGR